MNKMDDLISRKPDIPDIGNINCAECKYAVDDIDEERPKMLFCSVSGHALDIMYKGLPIWGCPIADAWNRKG